ncbi:MAG: hypothetical protein AAF035_05745 [Pseudomonadota bacterium]
MFLRSTPSVLTYFTRTAATVLVALGLAFVQPAVTPAQAGLLEPHINLRTFPECDDVKVLRQVVEKFNWAEDNTWHRGFYVTDLANPHERMTRTGYEIPRRYCRAQAVLSNGHHRLMYYLIEGGQGLAGTGFHVEFCLRNADGWRVHNGACRTLNW